MGIEAKGYTIEARCDGEGCNELGTFAGRNRTDAKSNAFEQGWKITRKGKVYCPECK